jgi:hypothetical protein
VPDVSWAGSSWFLTATYGVVAVLTASLGRAEATSQHVSGAGPLWPRFWYGTTVLLLVMAIGRASDSGHLLSQLGRQQARSQGWYEDRRLVQAPVVGLIAATWGIGVLAAIWRVPGTTPPLPAGLRRDLQLGVLRRHHAHLLAPGRCGAAAS